MLIGFDASRAFVDEATGTENYSLNLLKALAKIDRKNRYRVYLRESQIYTPGVSRGASLRTPGVKRGDWPNNFEFKVIRPRRFWTQIGLAWETWKNPVDLLFVPAHTLPILRKRKIFKGTTSSQSTTGITGFKNERACGTRDTLVTRDTRYVVTIHDLGVEYLPSYHQFPQRYYLDLASKYAASTADALIAVSEATRKDLTDRYKVDPKKVFVVPEGVDSGFFKPRGKDEVERIKDKYKISGSYILFVGTVQPRKNLEMLIEAFARLIRGTKRQRGKVNRGDTLSRSRDKFGNTPGVSQGAALRTPGVDKGTNDTLDNLQLVIAGKLGWAYQDILDAPKKYGIEDKVKFLGYVDRVDLPSLYTEASVLAAPSLFEGFDLPILEALACGCNVIASDIGAHREIFQKLAGFGEGTKEQRDKPVPIVLAKPKDVSRWSQFLYQSISQYDKRQSFVAKRRELALKFSWYEAAKKTLKVFERVLR